MAKALIMSPFKNSPAFAGLPPSLNSFDAGNAVDRHFAVPIFREVEVTQELMTFCTRYCNCSVNVLCSLLNPLCRETRKFVIIVCIVPCVQTCLVVRPHFSGYVGRLVAVVRPSLLIAEDLSVFRCALCIDFAVVHRLFAQCCQSRVVVGEPPATRPFGRKALRPNGRVAGGSPTTTRDWQHWANNRCTTAKSMHRAHLKTDKSSAIRRLGRTTATSLPT